MEPFRYEEAAGFHPSLGPGDLARTWFVCGGIPFYLQLFDARASIAANIQNNFLCSHAPLYREAEFLIREELREVERYQAVLMALANGSLRAVEVAKRAGIPHSNIQYYLRQLMELGYISRRFPLTLQSAPAAEVRYAVSDPVLRFWFRFIFPHASRIVSLSAAQAYDQLIAPELEAYNGCRFEALCREALPRLYQIESLQCPFEVGEYWSSRAQIDLVSLRDDGRIDIGECRWGNLRSWTALCQELEQKLRAYPNPENRTLQGWLFTRQRCPNKSEQYRLIALEDIYEK